MLAGWNPTGTEASLSIKSRLLCSKGTLLTVKLFTLYILVLTGYRSQLMRAEFRTAMTRATSLLIFDLNEILVKNRVSDVKTLACWAVGEPITEFTADIQFISLSYHQTDSVDRLRFYTLKIALFGGLGAQVTKTKLVGLNPTKAWMNQF